MGPAGAAAAPGAPLETAPSLPLSGADSAGSVKALMNLRPPLWRPWGSGRPGRSAKRCAPSPASRRPAPSGRPRRWPEAMLHAMAGRWRCGGRTKLGCDLARRRSGAVRRHLHHAGSVVWLHLINLEVICAGWVAASKLLARGRAWLAGLRRPRSCTLRRCLRLAGRRPGAAARPFVLAGPASLHKYRTPHWRPDAPRSPHRSVGDGTAARPWTARPLTSTAPPG